MTILLCPLCDIVAVAQHCSGGRPLARDAAGCHRDWGLAAWVTPTDTQHRSDRTEAVWTHSRNIYGSRSTWQKNYIKDNIRLPIALQENCGRSNEYYVLSSAWFWMGSLPGTWVKDDIPSSLMRQQLKI
ncbi:hypothetical protein CEXT_281211 [Caerostris extrusa]|uniref:Uncharacterized protein n=1 Tax=Caerostris extrusa TaxID=172846 RepID=A0AAV4Y330_CAEEX|nr:hypothetical protein CEXT_281211 [Caerostris extrusa]